MNFFDEQMENAKAAFGFAKENAVKVKKLSKLKIEERKLQNRLKEQYVKLGRQYYLSVKGEGEVQKDELIEIIDELKAQLKELRDEIDEQKR